mgnify:CR=1 FL=1
MSKFSGILVWDGTYISVRGYKTKIPLIWGIDYKTHDIPHFILAPSENYVACLNFFRMLKKLNYPLIILICDGNEPVKQAVLDVYPNAIIQTCLKHYIKNIRTDLNIASSDKYIDFYNFVYDAFFFKKCSKQHLAHEIARKYEDFKDDEKQYDWMTSIMQNLEFLTNYHRVPNAPCTTNLIEGYNGHLKDRTKSIRGFKSFYSAYYWLNAYILKRRFRVFTACSKKFCKLNGYASIHLTAKNIEDLPNLFRILPTKK